MYVGNVKHREATFYHAWWAYKKGKTMNSNAYIDSEGFKINI